MRDDDGRRWYGVGSCNSKERKYAAQSWVPLYTLDPEERQRAEAEEWPQDTRVSKRGNSIIWVQPPNAPAYDLVNTIQKMAVKRAYIAATLRATGAHRVFTQDMEDIAPASTEPPASNNTPATEATPRRPAPTAAGDTPASQELAKLRYDAGKALTAYQKAHGDDTYWAFVSLHCPDAVFDGNVRLGDLGASQCERIIDLAANAPQQPALAPAAGDGS